jgi:hypothetical protein
MTELVDKSLAMVGCAPVVLVLPEGASTIE